MNLDDLEEKARKATAGPWRYQCGEILQLTDGGEGYPLDYYLGGKVDSETIVGRDDDGDMVLADRNAEHIAAASPSVVLALIARLRKAEAVCEAAEKLCNVFYPSMDARADVLEALDEHRAALRSAAAAVREGR